MLSYLSNLSDFLVHSTLGGWCVDALICVHLSSIPKFTSMCFMWIINCGNTCTPSYFRAAAKVHDSAKEINLEWISMRLEASVLDDWN